MTTEQIVQFAVAVVSGGVITKLIDWARDARAGHMQKRRAEVDKAITERDKAVAGLRYQERWARILEEALAITRRKYIDAPCTNTDDLDPYPSRPDRDKP